ncbi:MULTISPECIES: hypothetical protein [Glaesserella]|uniref:Lipoprotein SmpA/OmlA domain-containing protein n=1 Tax=Glaesserella australis TaxID=2094024 RepID=A0A328BXR7_9PAST|nr:MULTISPECIES: hypothetical protein [Glaesserella]AUI67048.1 hypothetical protein CJD39_10950 [Glaesserella sp. 15-184]RAL18859.1 hypothetical protein C5N92_05700 [Glaesserella australis]
MNKVLLKLISLGVIGFILTSCESSHNTYSGAIIEQPKQEENWTRQPLENAKYLKQGMTETEVIQIMGEPVTREFQGRRSALQWCSTGTIGTNNPYDRFLLAAFTDEKLTEIKNFSNKDEFAQISAQVEQYGGIDCSSLIQNVHWLDQPNQIIEYRTRDMHQYQ